MADASVEPAAKKVELLAPFDQVAGHATGPLTRFYVKDGKIYKPCQGGSRGDREADFYSNILKEIPDFAKFVPQFFGIEEIEFPHEVHTQKHKFLVLEDLTHYFDTNTLCVADIKMGIVTYDSQATEKKRNYEIEKASSTTTVTLGFRVCGLKVYEHGIGLKKYDKNFGKKLDEKTIEKGLESFFHSHHLRGAVLPIFIEKLRELLAWFEKNAQFSFVGTSLLLLYDGKHHHEIDGATHTPRVDVKVIDFAHVDRLGKVDEGYIFGLKNLIQIFEQIEGVHKAKSHAVM